MTELFIDLSPVVLGGPPMFPGTRVPASVLIDHIEASDRPDGSLEDHAKVTASESGHSLFRGRPAPHTPRHGAVSARPAIPEDSALERRKASHPCA